MIASKIDPLIRAIINLDFEAVKQLKNSTHFQKDQFGFTPLELSQLLGWEEGELLLQKQLNRAVIKVKLREQKSPISLSIPEFENAFKLVYRRFLNFSSYKELEEIIPLCPYLLRLESFYNQEDKQEIFYKQQIGLGMTANTAIQWIDPEIEYGLFAEEDLAPRAFIGEYTGLVRRVSKNNSQLNPYSFEYPTKFFSSKYFVIDSLREGNVTRFINHSDEPNLQPLWINRRGVLHLIFIAKRVILKGTELTFNYGSDYWLHRKQRQS